MYSRVVMNAFFKQTFFLCFVFLSLKLFPGFAAGTIVKVPGGYKKIEQLQPGNFVYSMTKSGKYCLSKVKKTTSCFLSHGVAVLVGDDVFIAAPQQLFYDSQNYVWHQANQLHKSKSLLSGHRGILVIDDVAMLDQEIEFFDIHLDKKHTFLIGTQNIVVHNFFIPPFFIGLSWALGETVSFEGVTGGLSIFGLWLGAKLLRGDDKKYTPSFSAGLCAAGAGGPDPDDDEWKRMHPNGRYHESPKHHPNSPDYIGKPPPDGQAALDVSKAVKGSTQRVAVQDGNIIILKETEPGLYHGYIANNWGNLPQKVRNALYDAGWIRDISTGKIKK